MRVPLSWLKDYVSLDGIPVQELAERLTTAGLEVASVEYIGVPGPAQSEHLVWDAETIRVAEILAVAPHPDADRLRLVTVSYGATEPKTVVTGAPNVRVGQRVAYAMTGATVINGYSEGREHIRLEPKKLRGILSEGMVLSERELGLSDTHEGILELPAEAEVGTPLQNYLGDIVLEVDLTPNLGRAASVIGIAREVAALFNRPLRPPPLALSGSGAAASEAVRLDIQVPDLNPRFTASLIRGVTIGPSPWWMQRRLRLVGMRPINNVVDVTNYVMMEWGQPLHAFDYDKLLERARRSGADLPTIITRLAQPGETLMTLDKAERELSPEDVLVTDTVGILAIAGVMGGAETEVSDETRTILLEAAAWNFISVRRTSTRHLLFSEAAYRFSRGVHPAEAMRGNQRATRLIAELGGGEIAAGVVDSYPRPAAPIVLELTTETVNRLLGTALSQGEIASYLERLAFGVQPGEQALRVTVPDHREDITIPADLVEEVARVHGLDNLPMTLMADALPPLRHDRAMDLEEHIRDLLVGLGLTETISYTMSAPEREALLRPQVDEGAQDISEEGYVRIANPYSQERRVMRRTLLVSAMETLQVNLRHRSRVAIFETGLAYLPQPGQPLPHEERRLVIAVTGPTQRHSWLTPESASSDFYEVKGLVEELLRHLHLHEQASYEVTDHPTFQPGRVAELRVAGQSIGTLGELHPRVRRAHGLPEQRIALADLSLDRLIAAIPAAFDLVPIPRYPAVVQDLAVVVDEATPAARVEQVIREAGGEHVTQLELFDLYRGHSIPEGKKSLAYSLRYVHPEKTFTDGEVATLHSTITQRLRQQLGAQIRGEDS
ncbi:MAG: phenylalanine--tRNA ligase subunit beta [Ardenticatenales bacterium]|nr:phenylalanine--tRNA ligase subunit beta [Ardenticatenales bacterium]